MISLLDGDEKEKGEKGTVPKKGQVSDRAVRR
jgi:hypothetical protein